MTENNNLPIYVIKQGQGLWNADLHIFDTLPSTNSYCLRNIHNMCNGIIIRAIKQTAGKGRFTRKWEAPENQCLTFSMVIELKNNTPSFIDFLPATAIAIHKTLQQYNISGHLKWPNDVMVNDKKISGILAESNQTDDKLIIGIGLNINIPSNNLKNMKFPQPPTSLMAETGIKYNISEIYNTLISALEEIFNNIMKNGLFGIIEYWRKYDYLTGKDLTLQNNETIIAGKYAGMQNNGQIKIIDKCGKIHLLWSGDVTILK